MEPFSILMTIYYRENPLFIRDALRSILNQTLMPNEIVIVKDGLLPLELDRLLKRYQEDYAGNIKLCGYEENKGQGFAANFGLEFCSYSLVGRMDFDDISKPMRFQKQVDFMSTHEEIAILGAWFEEFENTSGQCISLKRFPEVHEELVHLSKKRSPFAHPTVFFRKEAVLDSGGYRGRIKEDYNLWVRMFLKGYRGHNLQESLLFYRITKDFYRKKGGFYHVKEEVKLHYAFFKWKHINWLEMLRNILINTAFRMIPSVVRKKIYVKFLRRQI